MANMFISIQAVWWGFRQAQLDAKDIRGFLKQTSYDAPWDMVVHRYRCRRTGIDVTINGNRHKRGEANRIARRMLFKGRFQVAIQREIK